MLDTCLTTILCGESITPKTKRHLTYKIFITGNIGPYTTQYQQYKFNLSKSSFKQQKTKK